jgi:steroid 5-alpha reductase family enzyme
MSPASLLLVNLAVIAVVAAVAWLISLPLRDASIMDVFWGLGFVIVAWTGLIATGGVGIRSWLLTTLITIWGLRLAGYLAWRKWGQPEDHRYASLRQSFGERFWLVSLVVVFGLQAGIMWLVALPLPVGLLARGELNWLDGVGTGLWLIGLLFESVGDYQLATFKANPANHGRVCDRGLWRYTRHPNYFGDFLVWWGLYFIALAGGAAWWIVISPLLMSLLLMRISGVGLLEKSLVQRTTGYRDYISRTSPFFPWPPRRN